MTDFESSSSTSDFIYPEHQTYLAAFAGYVEGLEQSAQIADDWVAELAGELRQEWATYFATHPLKRFFEPEEMVGLLRRGIEARGVHPQDSLGVCEAARYDAQIAYQAKVLNPLEH